MFVVKRQGLDILLPTILKIYIYDLKININDSSSVIVNHVIVVSSFKGNVVNDLKLRVVINF